MRHGHWSPDSAQVHGIRGNELRAQGKAPARVAALLNAVLGPCAAWCDGGPYNAYWGALFKAGGIKACSALGGWHRLTAMLGADRAVCAAEWLEQSPSRHRARADAGQLLFALAHAVGPIPVLPRISMPPPSFPQQGNRPGQRAG